MKEPHLTTREKSSDSGLSDALQTLNAWRDKIERIDRRAPFQGWIPSRVVFELLDELAAICTRGTASPQPKVDWFSAKKALLAGITACHDLSMRCELAARNMSDESSLNGAEAWRVHAAVIQAFIEQYEGA